MADSQVFGIEQSGRTLVVIPAGEHIGFKMKQVQNEADALVARIREEGIRHVVVDASKTAYFSSIIIGALIQLWEAVTAAGGKFALCHLNDDALSALVAMRLDTKWPHYDTRAEALEALRKEE